MSRRPGHGFLDLETEGEPHRRVGHGIAFHCRANMHHRHHASPCAVRSLTTAFPRRSPKGQVAVGDVSPPMRRCSRAAGAAVSIIRVTQMQGPACRSHALCAGHQALRGDLMSGVRYQQHTTRPSLFRRRPTGHDRGRTAACLASHALRDRSPAAILPQAGPRDAMSQDPAAPLPLPRQARHSPARRCVRQQCGEDRRGIEGGG